MAKTALPTLVLCTLVILTVRTMASSEKYQVDVALPLSSSYISYNIAVPEGEILTVCVVRSITNARSEVIVTGETNPQILSALGRIDYSPVQIYLTFEKSTENQTKCGEFSIIQDGLDEGQETFILSLSQDYEVQVPGSITVNIHACKQGDILTKSLWESFSIVEYCKDSTQWVILCDESDQWTMEDATVVCTQAGRSGGEVHYHELGNKIHNARETVPQCVGNESHIDDCDSTRRSECNPVLVDCGSTDSGGTNSTVNIDRCKEGDIILTKSVRESFSAVEYCKDSTQWVTLCDESNEWTLDDATVACRQIGRSGGQVTYHQSENKIWNARGTVPQCAGYEHRIDDCMSINTTKECRPVLVNCGLDSRGDNNSSDDVWILIVIGVPPLLLIILTVVCAIVIRVVWKKWTFYRSDQQQTSNPDDDLKIVPNAAYASVHHSSSTRPDP